MNYFNALAELDTVTTTHLSDKGSQQVQEFIDFVKPLIPDIRKGEAAKAEIAKYYLERKGEYTSGCVKVLEPLVSQLGVSTGYISQIKKAGEYKAALNDSQLRRWVEEHPVSVQYHLTRINHGLVMDKFRTGEHFSKREAENAVAESKAKTEPTEPVTDETTSAFQQRMSLAKEMVEDTSKPYIYNTNSAETYMASTVPGVIAACMQKLSEIQVCDDKRVKQLQEMQRLISKALAKPRHYEAKAWVK